MKTSIRYGLTALIFIAAPFAHADAEGQGGCAIAGSSEARLTIEEYADFDCKYCAQGSEAMDRVLKEYPGQIRLVFRNMPLSKIHPEALLAAKAFSAVCLQSPSLAYTFQKELFEKQEQLESQGEPFLFTVASSMGVNLVQMKSDMNGEAVAQSLAEDQLQADTHQFRGTPSFMIGNEPVTGTLPDDQLKKIIDKQLNP